MDLIAAFRLFGRRLPIHFVRRGPSRIGTDRHIPDPPTFSLPTTFNHKSD
jgi:hypothetical protein